MTSLVHRNCRGAKDLGETRSQWRRHLGLPP
jgi:hypothetical protein